MKESKKLILQAGEEDNDLKAMGILNKVIRAKRSENFVDKWLDILTESYTVLNPSEGKFTTYNTSEGTLDYFPKANKLLIRKTNKWIKPGLRWIYENLIPKEK